MIRRSTLLLLSLGARRRHAEADVFHLPFSISFCPHPLRSDAPSPGRCAQSSNLHGATSRLGCLVGDGACLALPGQVSPRWPGYSHDVNSRQQLTHSWPSNRLLLRQSRVRHVESQNTKPQSAAYTATYAQPPVVCPATSLFAGRPRTLILLYQRSLRRRRAASPHPLHLLS